MDDKDNPGDPRSADSDREDCLADSIVIEDQDFRRDDDNERIDVDENEPEGESEPKEEVGEAQEETGDEQTFSEDAPDQVFVVTVDGVAECFAYSEEYARKIIDYIVSDINIKDLGWHVTRFVEWIGDDYVQIKTVSNYYFMKYEKIEHEIQYFPVVEGQID